MCRKRILVTAGSTQVPIDQVRSVSNIFKGRTGTDIATHFDFADHEVTLLTSNPEIVPAGLHPYLTVIKFRTYDELSSLMEREIVGGNYDIVIHSVAVSDYKVEGVFYRDESGELFGVDNSKKMSSSHSELFLKLVPTEKIIDKIREPWGFKGILVKFKLQVGINDAELLEIAKKSRLVSGADILVANCLEWAKESAYIVSNNGFRYSSRAELPSNLQKELGL